MDEKFFHNLDWALRGSLNGERQGPPTFGGKPGERVPAVDSDDLKTVWQIGKDAQARHSGNVAVGMEVMRRACKPEANIEAVYYRSTLIWLVTQVAPNDVAPYMREGRPDDAVFRAAAEVPCEWMGVGIVRQGPPFELKEFLQLCAEASEKK